MERRLHTRHRARTTVYINIPGGRRKLCRAVNLSATRCVHRDFEPGTAQGGSRSSSPSPSTWAVTKPIAVPLSSRTSPRGAHGPADRRRITLSPGRSGVGGLIPCVRCHGRLRLYGAEGVWCRLEESNPRPDDYKSTALPTELSRPREGRRL